MKPITLPSRSFLLALTILGITLALVSWDFKQSPRRYRQPVNDTVPKSKSSDREKKVRDLDDVLDELNNADMKVNMEKVQKEINEAMKNFDGDKLKSDIEKGMKEVDVDKIRKEVDESMAKVDWDKMKREVDESMAKIDWDKMKKELEEVKNINLDKLNIDMKQVEQELKNLGPQMEKAKVEIEKAKADMREYRDFVNGLQNDGLINKKEGYTIKHKDGELIVNDKKVSNEIYSKYRSFLEKHKTFKITKNDDDFNIDVD